MSLNAPYTTGTVISSSQVSNDLVGLANGTNDTANNSMSTFRSESRVYFVSSGLIIPTSGTLAATTATGVAYIAGVRVNPSATPHTYTASKDTYVDLKNDGTYTYVEVANGAVSGMPLTANSIRIAKVVTNGTSVTTITQSPVADPLSGTPPYIGQSWDPLGNPIYPLANLEGRIYCTTDSAVSSSTFVSVTGMTINILLPYPAQIVMNGTLDFDGGSSASAPSIGVGIMLQSTPTNQALTPTFVFVNASTADRKTISQNYYQSLATNTLYTFQAQIQKTTGTGTYTAHAAHSGFSYIVKPQ